MKIANQNFNTPFYFEKNTGQTSPDICFLSRGKGYTVYLSPSKAVMVLKKPVPVENGDEPPESSLFTPPPELKTYAFGLEFTGCEINREMIPEEELPSKSNYFIGNNPDQWYTDIPTFSKVKVPNLYPGIDLIYYGNQNQLEYDLIVFPGSSPDVIHIELQGISKAQIDEDGNLLLNIEEERFTLYKPNIYQTVTGERMAVSGSFNLNSTNILSFDIEAYDPNLPLIIDPVLIFSTYLGGPGIDYAEDMAADPSGNLYITGRTQSTGFPVQGAYQGSNSGGYDVFISKFNSSGSLIYSTYLGGSLDDYGIGIAVDSSGNPCITGMTVSSNFPIQTPLPGQSGNHGGGGDAFVAKLISAGNILLFSTYLGGSGTDYGNSVAVDPNGYIYVTGITTSGNFPVANAFQASPGGSWDAFVIKINPAFMNIEYSSYLGGNGDDRGSYIAVDVNGYAYITGYTHSTNFPLLSPYQSSKTAQYANAYITKLTPSGALSFSTYFGGNYHDEGQGIAVDGTGIYLTGYTGSGNFPVLNAEQAGWRGGWDAFITKMNLSGNTLIFSTFLGGSGNDYGRKIDVNSSGAIYVTGETDSADFPVLYPLYSSKGGGFDAFAAKYNPSGRRVYSTYLGGSGDDYGTGICALSDDLCFVAGKTASNNFPTQTPFQNSFQSPQDAFITGILEQPANLSVQKTSNLIQPSTSQIFANSLVNFLASCQVGTEKVLVCYRDIFNSGFGTAVVLDTSGASITPGSPFVFYENDTSAISCCEVDTNKVLVCFRSAAGAGMALVLTISDSSMNASPPQSFATQNASFNAVCKLGTDKAMIVYSGSPAEFDGSALVLSVTGTTITVGEPLVFFDPANELASLCQLDTDKALIAFGDKSNLDLATAVVLNVSGTTITPGSPIVLASAAFSRLSLLCISTDKAMAVYSNALNSHYGTAVILNITGSSVSAAAPYVFEPRSINELTASSMGNNYVFVSYTNSQNLKTYATFLKALPNNSIASHFREVIDSSVGSYSASRANSNKALFAYPLGNEGRALTIPLPSGLNVGSFINFSIEITNTGPSMATGVTLVDTLPTGADLIWVIQSQGTWSRDGNVLTSKFYNLNPNTSVSVATFFRLNTGGANENTVHVSANERDPNPEDNTASMGIIINTFPNAPNINVSTNEDIPISGIITGSDEDGDMLTYEMYSPASHGTAFIDPNGNWTYTPDLNFHGTDSFKVAVSDGNGGSVMPTVNISVMEMNDFPSAPNYNAATIEDTPVSGIIEGTDPDGDILSYSPGTLPTHGTVNVDAAGSWSYTPTLNFSGTDSFTVEVNDGRGGTAISTVNITVISVNDFPTAPNYTVSTPEDIAIMGVIEGIDPDGDPLSYSLFSPASHGTANVQADGNWIYIPSQNYHGTDSFSVEVSDGHGGTVVSTVNITVLSVNDFPDVPNYLVTTSENIPISGMIEGTDPDGDILSYSLAGEPSHGTVQVQTDGRWTYTPLFYYYGTDSFTVLVSDGHGGAVTSTVNIIIQFVNDPPSAPNYHVSTPEDTPLSGIIEGTDPNGDILTYSLFQASSHGVADVQPDGNWTYSPAPNYSGTDSFTVLVADTNGAAVVSTVNISVASVNDVPNAPDYYLSTREDTPLAGIIEGTDPDEDPLIYTLQSSANHGTIDLTPDGNWTYSPVMNYNGPDMFRVRVSDPWGVFVISTVNIGVIPVNDFPDAPNYQVATLEDTPISGIIEGTDPDGDVLSYSLSASPSHGTSSVQSDGQWLYTPYLNFNGIDSFSVLVSDGHGGTVISTVNISVVPVNDFPDAPNYTVFTPEDTLLVGVIEGTDPEGDPLTYTLLDGVSHGANIVTSDGNWVYIPSPNYHGTDLFRVLVSDPQEGKVISTVNITIAAVNDFPDAPNYSLTTPEDTPISGKIEGTDPDGDPLIYTLAIPASHGTAAVDPDGNYTYTPQTNYFGMDFFRVSVSDNKGGTVTSTVSIAITPTNDFPDAPNYTVITQEDTPASGVIEGTDPDGDLLTYSLHSAPSHGTVTLTPKGSWTYAPALHYYGIDTFRVLVSDNKDGSVVSTVNLSIVREINKLEFIPTPIQTGYFPSYANQVLTGDINGDAKTDFIIWQAKTGTWAYASPEFNNLPPVITIGLSNWAKSSLWTPLTGDFNGDGKADITVWNSSTGDWQVALSDGTKWIPHIGRGDYHWLSPWAKGSYWVPLAGDFNGDGKDDILVWNRAYGDWQVALSSGSTFIPSIGRGNYHWLKPWGKGNLWTPLAGDFNGDGKTDIALWNTQTGGFQVALSDGTQFIPAANNGDPHWLKSWFTGTDWTPMVGDFNGDGKDDIAVWNSKTGNWQVALSDGTKFVPDPNGGNYIWLNHWAVSPAWAPKTGDFNKDGFSDIAVWNLVNGNWEVALTTEIE
ncbi:MAG: Ig-like domain-containing protein [Clostridia bacterium]|nr:Ig-like domain-containing protein [Clostridia bacterium]